MSRLAVGYILLAVVILGGLGCISPREKVSILVFGTDHIMTNITKPNGFIIRINNEGPPIQGMKVVIHTPENIYLNSTSQIDIQLETGNSPEIGWVYSFTDDLDRKGLWEYAFDYAPFPEDWVFHETDFYSFQIHVEIINEKGKVIGNRTTDWSVTKWEI